METERQDSIESLYGKTRVSRGDLLHKIWERVKGWLQACHEQSAVVGVLVMILVGLSSWKGIPIHLASGGGEGSEILFPPLVGLAILIVGLLGMGYIFVEAFGIVKSFAQKDTDIKELTE